MPRFLSLLLAVLVFISSASTQEKYTISGIIKEARTGEFFQGASLTIAEKSNIGVLSNEYGFYSLLLPKGNYTFKVSYVGYSEATQTINLDSNITINWELVDKNQLEEVIISGKRKDDNLRKPIMGTEILNMNEIAKIPVIFGEKDIIKTMQLLPGIKSNGEGGNGFSVRGGATDQNLILLDEAPVYNASHLLGFFSTFNSDAIKDATIIKGNSPAQYGGRLSSVLDVKMKEGNNKGYNVTGGLGLISSRLSIEGPIQKDKSSFLISGRRTYADIFLKLSPDFSDSRLFFYDLNAKANYRINDKNKIYFSGYFGRDVLGLGNTFNTNWGNSTGTLRWNSIWNSRLFSNTSVIYSNYDYNINIKDDETNFNINSNIKDWNLKQDFSYYVNPKHSVRFGFNAIHHTITPTRFSGTISNFNSKKGRKGLETAVYMSDNYKATDKLSIDYGLRFSAYTILGGDTYNIYDNGVKSGTLILADGETGKTYYNAEPRITSNYRINDVSSIKAGYSRNIQNLHLMSNSTGGNPTDQWLGNSYNTKPEIADQVSLGYSRNFSNNNYEFNTEVYYKDMQNQIDYKEGADIQTVTDIESELLYGKGRAYGWELLFKKKTGKLNGWVGYTLSKTERKINGINNNEWYNARQDRTHDVSIVGIFELTKHWTLSAIFIYQTGNAVTFPTGKFNLNGVTVYQYASRNTNRLPAYHRLDFGATYEKKKPGRRFQSSWNFGLYNVYGRENAYTITFRDNPDDPTKTEALQTSLFRWVPGITYNFKF
ncbi:MAG: TonB-dependent receptor [Chitinophagaceae bacterium]